MSARVCATEGCATFLSQYNAAAHCRAHLSAMKPDERAIADPPSPKTRLGTGVMRDRIVEAVGDDAWTVKALAVHLGISRQRVRQHLEALVADGRLVRRREALEGQGGITWRYLYSAPVDFEQLMGAA